MMPFIASLLVKATVITLLALAGTRLARRTRAAVRHLLLAAAFATLLLVPVISAVAPAVRIAVPMADLETVAQGLVAPADETNSTSPAPITNSGSPVTAVPGPSPWPSAGRRWRTHH